jgi:hypothetical protein
LGEVIQNLNPPGIDEIDMGTIQMHGFLLSEKHSALSIEQRGPLCGNLALQLEEHVAPAFLNLRNLEHHLYLSFVFV